MYQHLSASYAVILLLTTLLGCEYVRPTVNAPLKQWESQGGYRVSNFPATPEGSSDSLLMIAAFSGGGTRASTLAFGALRELARTTITWEGQQKRLLDELNLIYALSGGTFTGAYYALYGDQIFRDFEYRFLRKDWESELKARVLRSPSNWFRLWSPYFGRAHIMAELLDEALFDKKTFADLAARGRPFLVIHATDMATLSRFEFNQFQFDLLCSDLSQLPIAWASAASAAMPLVLSPISLKNYAGHCGYQRPAWLEEAKTRGGQSAQRANEYLSYLEEEKRPYVHLVDGGLSDNIALRGVLEGTAVTGGLAEGLRQFGLKNVRKLVFLAVNAETTPDVLEFRSDKTPAISNTMSTLIDAPINRYSFDTIQLLRLAVEKWRAEFRTKARDEGSPFAADADIYFIDVSLSEVADPGERASLMKIPTTLYLTDEQIDRLLLEASRLIRNDKDFQRLMQDLQ